MADHLPSPPGASTLRTITPEIHVLPAGSDLARIWFADTSFPSGFAHFRSFGPTSSRFDHHLPGLGGTAVDGPRAMMYAFEVPEAQSGNHDIIVAAVAEVFQSTRTIDLRAGKPRLTIFQTRRDILLLDLTGFWTTRIGASALLSSGARDITRAWSRDLYDAFPDAEGLRYRSSMSGGHCLAAAFYERAGDAMPSVPLVDLELDSPHLRRDLVRAADRLGFVILP